MHIIFLNPQGNFDPTDSHWAEHPDFGGQLVYVKEVAQAMATMGHKVDILTRRMEDKSWPEFADEFDSYPGFETRLRIVRIPCGGPGFLAKEELWDHLGEWVRNIIAFYGDAPPDFATGHYADGGYAAALFRHERRIEFTFTGHSLGAQKLDKLGTTTANYLEMENRFRFSRRIAAERESMRRTSRIVTSTRQEREEQYAHRLYAGAVDASEAGKFAVIPPGVNTRIFTADDTPEDAPVHGVLRRRLGKTPRPCVIVSSRLDEKKNIIGVVEAFAASAALRRRCDLMICLRGIDNPFSEIRRLSQSEQDVLGPILARIEAAGLRRQVHFANLGSQNELAAAYRYLSRTGSVFALTAFYEPFGLAPIEAAACGLVCVATRNGGPSEIFEDGSGVLVDPFDADDIARGLVEALENHHDLATRGRRRVLAKYTWRKTAEAYLEVIAAAAGQGGDPDAPVPELDASGLIEDYLSRERSPG
ncbi:MAG: glycosyltransferase [Hyphomicrobiales bacterium]|nr:glycosyltransferase [Hyphomicrobiales bacterium]